MRRVLKWFMRVFVVLVLVIAAAGIWKREEVLRLLAVNTLFDAGRIVSNFSNMDRAFLTAEVSRGTGPVAPLVPGPQIALPDGVDEWISERDVTSLLVLSDGQVAYEDYYLGTNPQDPRIGWSLSKSFLSVLFGILLEEGTIASVDEPVTRYVPALTESAYADVTIHNLLQMTSGVAFDEDYLDYNSDINRMGRVLALGGSMDDFAAGLTEQARSPGDSWEYVSIDTHVLAMVIRGATGRDIPDLLSEYVIAPLGLEQSPYYLTDGHDVAFALGGINMTTRDYARFGQMIAMDGTMGDQQIAPADWIDASTRASAPTKPGKTQYGYQWWIAKQPRASEVFARGVYGPYIYIDRARDIVIVVTAADRNFREDGVHDQNLTMMRRIADQT